MKVLRQSGRDEQDIYDDVVARVVDAALESGGYEEPADIAERAHLLASEIVRLRREACKTFGSLRQSKGAGGEGWDA